MLQMHKERNPRFSLGTQEMTLNQVISEQEDFIGRDGAELQAKKTKRKSCEQKPS